MLSNALEGQGKNKQAHVWQTDGSMLKDQWQIWWGEKYKKEDGRKDGKTVSKSYNNKLE